MRKKIKNVYPDIIKKENLYQAFNQTSLSKRSKDEVVKFKQNLDENINQLYKELSSGTYKPGNYNIMKIKDTKPRTIMFQDFPDRVVQCAIYLQLQDKLAKSYIETTCSCIKGKGPIKATNYLQHAMRKCKRKWGEFYVVQLDISKFFYRINRKILKKKLRKKIKDKRTYDLMCQFIDVKIKCGIDLDTGKFIRGVGIPIGNLLSQLNSNFYMDSFDHYVKEKLNVDYYVRYMDDMVALVKTKEEAEYIYKKMENYLSKKLRLTLNKKSCSFKFKNKITFCGRQIYLKYIKVKAATVKRERKKTKKRFKLYKQGKIGIEELRATVASYFGLFIQTNNMKEICRIYTYFLTNAKDTEDSELQSKLINKVWISLYKLCKKYYEKKYGERLTKPKFTKKVPRY